MKKFSWLFINLILISCKPSYYLFDNSLPGDQPEIFAEHIIANNNEHVGYCSFSPNGKELYYAITNDEWTTSKIIRISSKDLFRKDSLLLKDLQYTGEPFVTRDGKTLYFTAVVPPAKDSQWHADIYRSFKSNEGWSTPQILTSIINSKGSEWHVSVTDKNRIYFTSEREKATSALHGDIYSVDINGDYFSNLTKLPEPVNSDYNDSDPLIAPDESFLIFHSDRPGGIGQHDLYISFNKKGKWTDPVNMGTTINTPGWEMAPTLTPDGKYLLYTHRENMVTTKPSKILWVHTRILKKYQ